MIIAIVPPAQLFSIGHLLLMSNRVACSFPGKLAVAKFSEEPLSITVCGEQVEVLDVTNLSKNSAVYVQRGFGS